jgi:hypothetical protein
MTKKNNHKYIKTLQYYGNQSGALYLTNQASLLHVDWIVHGPDMYPNTVARTFKVDFMVVEIAFASGTVPRYYQCS